MNTSKPEFVVAIGGSVGYLAPLLKIFDNTLIDKVTYIILTHLQPGAPSLLKEILQWHSKLQVIEAADNMAVENNKVYTLPPGYYMTINNGIIHLQQRNGNGNCAIDMFMNSLAADFKERSMGIILSGGGNNGVEGAASIKEAGGIVFVQDPSSCETSILPQKVINSGNYDHILLPEQMPRFIMHYVANYLKKSRHRISVQKKSA